MRMPRAFIAATFAAAGGAAHAQTVDRYEMKSGPMLRIVPQFHSMPDRTVFMLDAATGRAWMLVFQPGSMGDRIDPYWLPLPELPDAVDPGPGTATKPSTD